MKVLVLSLLPPLLLFGQVKEPALPSIQRLAKTARFEFKQLDVNNLNATLSSEGPYCDYRRLNASGLEWPKGSGKSPIYTAGIWLGGIHRSSNKLRVSNIDYATEYQPGPILTIFNTTTNNIDGADLRASDPRYRLYKITKLDTLRNDQGNFISTNPDFLEWPGDLGAPYEDRNGDGRWTSGVDMPKFYGDMQIWCVINDLNILSHSYLSTSQPLGVEIQVLSYAFNQIGLFNNAMFMRWRIINKSDAAYDSLYIGLWSDPDLGDANDDLPGCDSILNLGYVYNGDDNDASSNGYGSTPPAAGFDLLQGPNVPASLLDSALWNGTWHRGYKNLTATSFTFTTNGTFSSIFDPVDGSPDYPAHAYDYLKGRMGTVHRPLMNGSREIKYWFSGDPVAGTGDLPSNFPLGNFAPQDFRMLLSSGPFTLVQNDTQEVVSALIISQGYNRLSSLAQLKEDDRYIQQAFHNQFRSLPTAKAAVTPGTSFATICIQCTPNDTDIKGITALIHKYDGLFVANLVLYDDGAHEDIAANDGIFGNSVSVPLHQEGLCSDLLLTRRDDTQWKITSAIENLTTSLLPLTSPIVLSDNLNCDGMVNPGENIRFGFSITNPNTFQISNLKVQAGDDPKSSLIPALTSGGIFNFDYNLNDSLSYFSFNVSPNYTANTITIPIVLTDDKFNLWRDSLSFIVKPWTRFYAATESLAGTKLDGVFQIIITNPSTVKNHSYVIRGIDSIDVKQTTGFSLYDETDSRVILSQSPLPDVYSHNLQPLEGFKILRGTVETIPTAKSIEFGTNSWFNPTVWHANAYLFACYGPESALTAKGGYHKVQILYAPILGISDANSNGKWDYGEKILFDTSGYATSQKAFMYNVGVFARKSYGFGWVPFSAFDIEDGSAQKLNIVVNDINKNFRWDPKETIYVMPTPYDSTGGTYDTTTGINLFTGPLPFGHTILKHAYWVVFSDTAKGSIPYATNAPMTLTPTYPLSSVNGFRFNPTVLTSVEPENGIPIEFSLLQNYPNPFNPTTVISYQIPVMSSVKLVVYDLLGREVVTLVNEKLAAGTHTVTWSATNVASGIYFYQLTAGNYTQTKKMMVLR